MLQGGEIIVILLVALIVLGPERLPEVARKLGEWTAELRNAARDVRHSLEAEVSGLKEAGDEIKAGMGEIQKTVDEMGRAVGTDGGSYQWTGPKPVSGPTPEDALHDLTEIERTSLEEE